MDTNREYIRKVIKLDATAAFLKLMSIAFIPVILINAVVQTSMWYLSILIDIAFILAYKARANFIKKQFASYKTVFATVVKFNLISFMRGTIRLTYSYEYEEREYTGSETIADFFRESSSIRENSTIKIIVNTDNPQKSEILDLLLYIKS